MSKVTFRNKNLDSHKIIPVYWKSDLPDIDECQAIVRQVPQMPTGMEKEEEEELHLKSALSAQFQLGTSASLIIPVPDTSNKIQKPNEKPKEKKLPNGTGKNGNIEHSPITSDSPISNTTNNNGIIVKTNGKPKKPINIEQVRINKNYKVYIRDYVIPENYIKVDLLPFELTLEPPSYDMDDDDFEWFDKRKDTIKCTEEDFERVMENLNRYELLGNKIITPTQVYEKIIRIHPNFKNEVVIAVYDYWLSKRISKHKSEIEDASNQVKTVGRGAKPPPFNSDHYICFRRRNEKMQTRKNRKNDEHAFEKMLRLTKELKSASTLLHLVNNREQLKLNIIKTEAAIWDKCFETEDWHLKKYNEIIIELQAETILKTDQDKINEIKNRKKFRKPFVLTDSPGRTKKYKTGMKPEIPVSLPNHKTYYKSRYQSISDMHEIDGDYTFKPNRCDNFYEINNDYFCTLKDESKSEIFVNPFEENEYSSPSPKTDNSINSFDDTDSDTSIEIPKLPIRQIDIDNFFSSYQKYPSIENGDGTLEKENLDNKCNIPNQSHLKKRVRLKYSLSKMHYKRLRIGRCNRVFIDYTMNKLD
ncbi:hypothetical protein A3Q56_06393 [Intoshia linei]|uniref:Enhancer of polycomb-like protein n=1 Tax=Intoshia linei TaxID=1819745 RepID=A0A177AV56_9BILA|nr:hypothetical protein A3Q56_06393 [Intoshia linei]